MKYYRRLGVLNFLAVMLLMHEYKHLESPNNKKAHLRFSASAG